MSNQWNQISASDLDRLVDLESYGFSIGDAGGSTAIPEETITGVWASVVQQGGGDFINQGQDRNFADYKVIIRYRPQLTENWIIVYEGLRMKIKQMQVDDTAYKRYLIIYCSTSIQQTSWS
jgi:SPP1 family predicted phage head-tail adaptor